MIKLLVLLQNAWKHGAQEGQRQWLIGQSAEASHAFWERALWASPTGFRLEWMIPGGVDARIGNASPVIGGNSKSKFPMEPEHVLVQIEAWQPRVVLLLGTEAKKARYIVEERGLAVVEGPHPAWRLLSREKAREVHERLSEALNL